MFSVFFTAPAGGQSSPGHWPSDEFLMICKRSGGSGSPSRPRPAGCLPWPANHLRSTAGLMLTYVADHAIPGGRTAAQTGQPSSSLNRSFPVRRPSSHAAASTSRGTASRQSLALLNIVKPGSADREHRDRGRGYHSAVKVPGGGILIGTGTAVPAWRVVTFDAYPHAADSPRRVTAGDHFTSLTTNACWSPELPA
jgi:hypothetical protein